jgi:arsenate reductase
VSNEFSLHKEISPWTKYTISPPATRVEKMAKSLPKEHDFKFHDIKQESHYAGRIRTNARTCGRQLRDPFSKKAQLLYKSMDFENKSFNRRRLQIHSGTLYVLSRLYLLSA